MPVRITATARSQYFGIVHRYLTATRRRAARPLAAQRLIESYDEAVETLARGPKTSFSYPRPYPQLVSFGFRWIKVHRYWFGYVPGPDPIITNLLDEVSDIPAHVTDDREPIDTA